MRNRSRTVKFQLEQLGENRYAREPYASNPAFIVPYTINWNPDNYLVDSCADGTCPGPPYKWVNPLSIQHSLNPAYYKTGSSGSHRISGSGNYEYRYYGKYWVSLGVTAPALIGSSSAYNSTSMNALGATGWKKFQPAKPVADVGVMLGESRELPRLLRDSVSMLKTLAHHPSMAVRNMSYLANAHLATQFGWLPLLRDLEKCKKAMDKGDDWMRRVRRENGKWVHRGGTIAKGETTTLAGRTNLLPLPTSYSLPPEGISYSDIYVTEGYRVWFSAWFKYYIADFDSAATQLRLKARLWGLDRTPSIVWNLLPWSWLVDWFSNLGDNIDNLVPIDGLVAKMPCVMRHCWTYYHTSCRQRYKEFDGSYQTYHADNYKRCETKSRAVASPFGFDVTWDNLSLRQWSILAALGITRSSSRI